jgi:hypothetical protein
MASLPLTHSPILRLTDQNTRKSCQAGKCYNLVRLPKEKIICTIADAEHLKSNLNYVLHKFKGHNFATVRWMIWAVFYHHFNIHYMCGEWCCSLRYKDNPEELKNFTTDAR